MQSSTEKSLHPDVVATTDGRFIIIADEAIMPVQGKYVAVQRAESESNVLIIFSKYWCSSICGIANIRKT